MKLIDLVTAGGPAGQPARHGDALLALVVVGVVAMLILPLPTVLLDVLITCNISLALLVLLVSLHTGGGRGFSAFPALLLITTLVRLGLNVSSTRLILLQADAGEVISAFGGFVVGGSLVVGAVVFLIITLIQYVVIARGSERVAEVAARFTLDALPGKQLAIDADVRAGIIHRADAHRRRANLERECQLYGAMDGAMKFVKGDAIAAILITLVDIGGGLLVGVAMRGMEIGAAARIYTQLTIGDGLVSQVPALMISLAAGIVVTRVASEGEELHLGQQLGAQLFGKPRSLLVAAGLLTLLALVPGLPGLPFGLLALAGAALGFALLRSERRRGSVVAAASTPSARPPRAPVTLEVGDELARCADPATRPGRQLEQLLSWTDRLIWQELGLPLAPVAVRAGAADIQPTGFRVLVHGVPAANGTVNPAALVALCPRATLESLGLTPTERAELPGVTEPAWVLASEARATLERAGVQPLEPPALLALHVSTVLRRRAPDLLGIQQTRELLDGLQQTSPALVREVVPARLSLVDLSRLLQDLLAEGISVRELGQILEAVAALPGDPPPPPGLTELVRPALRRAICHPLASSEGTIGVLKLNPAVEDLLEEDAAPPASPLGDELTADLLEAIRAALPATGQGPGPVIVTSPAARRPLRRLLQSELPDLPVLSYAELNPDLEVETLGMVDLT